MSANYPETRAFWEKDPETGEVTDIGSYTNWPDK